MSEWSNAVAQAQKVLGKGKLPKARVDPAVLYPILIKVLTNFNKGREDLEKKLLETQNAYTAAKNTLQQYEDIVEGADFDLDEDNDDDKKKITAARAIIIKALDNMEKSCDSW